MTLGLFDKVWPQRPAEVGGMSLRPFQVEAHEGAWRHLTAGRNTLVVMATGLGKTRLAASIAKRWPGRVMFVAHTGEILEQAWKTLRELTGEVVGYEKASDHAWDERIVVASMQTVRSEKRFRKFRNDPFTLIIVDETHRVEAKSYRDIIAAFPEAVVLGVTATPKRADGVSLGNTFESLGYTMNLWDGIEQGWLCPFRCLQVDVHDIDISGVKANSDDLSGAELDNLFVEKLAGIGQPLLENCGDLRTIVFTPGVATANGLAEWLNSRRPNCARAVHGKTNKDLRKQLVEDHKNGRYQFLINCDVFSEGYDDPGVRCVALARPTKSQSKLIQWLGRGGRPLPGVVDAFPDDVDSRLRSIRGSAKPDYVVLDLAFNVGKHELQTPASAALEGSLPKDVVARARKKVEEGDTRELGDVVKAARLELADEARRAREAFERIRARVSYRVNEIDPFSMYGIKESEVLKLAANEEPASPAQRAFLRQHQHPFPENGTSAMAQKLIKTLKARMARGLAVAGQIAYLKKFGIDARNMSYLNAARHMENIQRDQERRWQKQWRAVG